jgi:hypothetical protein
MLLPITPPPTTRISQVTAMAASTRVHRSYFIVHTSSFVTGYSG